MGILCDLIVSAKDKNKDSLMEIINKFRPLIKKQAYALNYEDAENDLIVDMIELIYNMPFFQHDGQAVTYISTSIRHSYVKFLKQRIRLRENECIYDPDIIKNIENLSEDFEKKDKIFTSHDFRRMKATYMSWSGQSENGLLYINFFLCLKIKK